MVQQVLYNSHDQEPSVISIAVHQDTSMRVRYIGLIPHMQCVGVVFMGSD
jgi:hypothetical protein